ncbi:hypothetical protein [Paraburkholderia silvatlantica]|uniref:hypothetical protein n=1 Tax=Paraburkholderia silvatlantica TaxID=321895 RepID=UPI003750E571
MNGRELITASMRELERVKVIEAVIEGRLRCFQAAEPPQRPLARTPIPISAMLVACCEF